MSDTREEFEKWALDYHQCVPGAPFMARMDNGVYVQPCMNSELAAWQASRSQGWVSVKERLPEDGVSAVIFVPEWEDMYLRFRVAWINYDYTPPIWVHGGEEVENVTHWRTDVLAAPPAGESEGA